MLSEFPGFLGAMLTPTIAVLGSYFAYQQYRMNWMKLQVDRYDKRYAIYEGTIEFIGEIYRNADVGLDAIFRFAECRDKSLFLYDESMETYLETIHKKAMDLYANSALLKDQKHAVGAERTRLAEEHSEIIIWFMNERKEIRRRFFLYLHLGRTQSRIDRSTLRLGIKISTTIFVWMAGKAESGVKAVRGKFNRLKYQ